MLLEKLKLKKSRRSLDTSHLLKVQDVKQILCCSIPYVHKLVERKQLPCVKLPGLGLRQKRAVIRFKAEDIQAFIERCYKSF